MNSQTQPKIQVVNKKRLIIVLLSIIITSLVLVSFFLYKTFSHDMIYKGVFVDELDCSNLSTDKLKNLLSSNYTRKMSSVKITLSSGNNSRIVSLSEIKVQFDIENTVNNAYSVGRTGNVFKKLSDIFSTAKNKKKIHVSFKYDTNKLNEILDEENQKISKSLNNPRLNISDTKVSIVSGQTCKVVDKATCINSVENQIMLCTDAHIELPLKIVSPSKIDVDKFFKEINIEEKNASFDLEKNTVKILPHVVGRKIQKSQLIKIAKELEGTENVEKVLPVQFIQPKINTEDANKNLFKNTLASYSTVFYTSNQNDKNRGINIRIAVSKASGKILLPGKIFSFNDAVGERNANSGYKTAHTYISGKIVDSVGGGICQVSTTLFNSVLLSKLDIVERSNHMFTVGYVPFGMDAAVSYNSVDFKFKNKTNWPVKIEGYVTKENRIVFSIIGTNESANKTYEYRNVKIKTVPPEVKYIDDPSLEQGKTEVVTNGMIGYVVDTYRIIKENGKILSDQKIYTSVYKPLQKEVKRGTKKLIISKVITEPQTPVPSSSGVDDADNPPAIVSTSSPTN